MAITPSTLLGEASPSASAAKRVRRRPSASHILIVIAVLLAFGLNYLALQDRSATVLVAVAIVPLAQGSVFAAADARLVEVAADFEGLDGLVRAEELEGLGGRILGRAIPAGGLIDGASLVESGSHEGLRVMSIPIAAEHAVGAGVSPGDRVDVISVVDGMALFVAMDLEVVSAADLENGRLSAAGSYFVVVAVDIDEALAIATAIDHGSVEVVRSTGALPLEGDGA